MVPPNSLSRLFVVLAAVGVEIINSLALLVALITTFIEIVIIVGQLNVACIILLPKKIQFLLDLNNE
tara:strand:- start:1070 stop:1270 length:201 start_codon:yes stop_codon:yes gene_type:complete